MESEGAGKLQLSSSSIICIATLFSSVSSLSLSSPHDTDSDGDHNDDDDLDDDVRDDWSSTKHALLLEFLPPS